MGDIKIIRDKIQKLEISLGIEKNNYEKALEELKEINIKEKDIDKEIERIEEEMEETESKKEDLLQEIEEKIQEANEILKS